MARFLDKAVLVTGGSSGIGQATAELFAREGARVVIAARRVEEGQRVAERIRAAGGSAIFIRTDVSQAEDCRAAVARTVEAFGRLDIAFNNAGITMLGKPLVDYEEAEWDQLMGINLKGMFLSMKYEIPEMLKAGGGAIVNTASVFGLVGAKGIVAYQTAKHGLLGLTKAAALEYCDQNIRVNAVCPAATESEMLDRVTAVPGVEDWFKATHPMGRFAKASEVAETVLFLASPAASYVTGAALTVDGGFTIP